MLRWVLLWVLRWLLRLGAPVGSPGTVTMDNFSEVSSEVLIGFPQNVYEYSLFTLLCNKTKLNFMVTLGLIH